MTNGIKGPSETKTGPFDTGFQNRVRAKNGVTPDMDVSGWCPVQPVATVARMPHREGSGNGRLVVQSAIPISVSVFRATPALEHQGEVGSRLSFLKIHPVPQRACSAAGSVLFLLLSS